MIITQINLFFSYQAQQILLDCLEHFLFLNLEECSNLLGLTKTQAHQLGDNPGKDPNALWTYSPPKMGVAGGKKVGQQEDGEKIVCLLYNILLP